MKSKGIINAAMMRSIRELVDFINEWAILKDDIVTVLREEERYILLYYTKDNGK